MISDALYLFCSFLQKFDFVFLLVYCISRLKVEYSSFSLPPSFPPSFTHPPFFDVFLALFVFCFVINGVSVRKTKYHPTDLPTPTLTLIE